MPSEIKAELVRHRLLKAYEQRPAYQQNDYIGWIGQAKKDETRAKRTVQMIEELRQGDIYMKMPWKGVG